MSELKLRPPNGEEGGDVKSPLQRTGLKTGHYKGTTERGYGRCGVKSPLQMLRESGVEPPHSMKEPAGSRRYEIEGRAEARPCSPYSRLKTGHYKI